VFQHFPERLVAASRHTLLQEAFCAILDVNLIHVPGVRGVPHLDKPYLPGFAVCLCGNVSVSISSSFIVSPVNFVMCDHHYHAVWALLLFGFRVEIALLYCVRGDQPLR
jgi:hypothetical protein